MKAGAKKAPALLLIGCKEDLGLPERELFEPWLDAEGIFRRKSRTLALKF